MRGSERERETEVNTTFRAKDGARNLRDSEEVIRRAIRKAGVQ